MDATTSPGSSGGQVTSGDAPAEEGPRSDAGPGQDATQSHGDASTGNADGSLEAGYAADAAAEAGPTCSATCVPAPPAGGGWQGPYALFEGSGVPLPSVPPCPANFANDLYDGHWALDAGPTACTCECGPVQNASCGPPTMLLFSDPNCATPCPQVSQAFGPACTAIGLTNCGGTHVILEGGAPSGSCSPDASSTVPPPAWEGNVRLCGPSYAASSSGCGAGRVCAPSSAGPAFTLYCIAQAGLLTCPSDYPVQHTYYMAYDDSRGCTACSCGPPSNVSCTASLLTYGSPSCGGGATSLAAPLDTCTSLGGSHAAWADAGVPSGGTCNASGGVPSGTLAPSTPTTVCCTQ